MKILIIEDEDMNRVSIMQKVMAYVKATVPKISILGNMQAFRGVFMPRRKQVFGNAKRLGRALYCTESLGAGRRRAQGRPSDFDIQHLKERKQ